MLCFNWPLHTSSTATWQACAKWLLSTMERKIFRAQKTCSEVRDIGAQGMWVPARITWSMCHVLTKNHLVVFWKLHLSLPVSPPFFTFRPSHPPALLLITVGRAREMTAMVWLWSILPPPRPTYERLSPQVEAVERQWNVVRRGSGRRSPGP